MDISDYIKDPKFHLSIAPANSFRVNSRLKISEISGLETRPSKGSAPYRENYNKPRRIHLNVHFTALHVLHAASLANSPLSVHASLSIS